VSETTYYRKGFGLKADIQGQLDQDYHSSLVDYFRAHEFRLEAGDLTLLLAREFGFCYGVDRAVEYAYEARRKFPDRRIHITGEIIHNPHVNRRIREMGINFLSLSPSEDKDFDAVAAEDVVILPAFGVTVEELGELRRRGSILVDTTCGSVLNVWKNVEAYARDDFTSVIHGKYYHEEAQATASRATSHAGGHYLLVRDMEETEYVARFIETGGDAGELLEKFRKAVSPDFDPDAHLRRIGLANQTTMLSSESLAIGKRLEQAMAARYGRENLAAHFRAFDTICSATQDRQDAIQELIAQPLQLVLVIGGYNSSNTNHLAEMADGSAPTFHIDDADCILDPERIRHKPVGEHEETVSEGWLPQGPARIGITAGASTPSSKIGEVVERVLRCRGVDPARFV
jgi:4-hydroxy-3-methylbut-2-enyl diphosphate reductase